ncbi:MAG TPA: hypothetical protein VMS31_00415 [Pyrinomonadaceae bacterium]|nr:hypothetical protein [Pyrinomonadaceae bacterium]
MFFRCGCFLLAIMILSACGRRENPAAFDAVSPKEAPVPSAAEPLPASGTKVSWTPIKVQSPLTAGTSLPVTVTFTNTGDKTWPDKATADPKEQSGGYAVRLCYSLVPAGKHVAGSQHLGERVDLVKPVAPGESVTLEVVVPVPEEPGDYILSFELLQELVVWFGDLGADALTIPVKVVPVASGANHTNTP